MARLARTAAHKFWVADAAVLVYAALFLFGAGFSRELEAVSAAIVLDVRV